MSCKPSPLSQTFDCLIATHGNISREIPNALDSIPASDQEWTNFQFVRAFDNFESFEAAAEFIHDWIKVEKHKVASVQRDLPPVFERIAKLRQVVAHLRTTGSEALPEQIDKLMIFQDLHVCCSDFKVVLTIGLLEACSLKYTIPMLIIRTLLGHLAEAGDLARYRDHAT